MPPERWDGGRVPLTQAAYQAWCARFIESVVGEPAVVVGCSMGAAMALVMAAAHPELVRGVVAVEAPFRAQGRLNPFLAHAAVNSAAHNPSYVRGLMSPLVSMGARRAAAWIYGQGALGVYAGDLAFYEEFDGGAVGPRIDARRTPVAFLAGAYDYSATPEDARRLAALIPGSSLEVMPELGHFPMVECPDLFRTYFVPALERVVTAAARGSG
jgi:pimeloyl-ACP methyl ester carboxylesterase